MSLTKVSYSMISGAPVNVNDYLPAGFNPATDDATAHIQEAIDTGYDVVFPYPSYTITCVKVWFFISDTKF